MCEAEAKEAHFFDVDERFAKGLQAYSSFFDYPQPDLKANCKYYFDATPSYVRNPLVPARLNATFTRREIEAMKFVLILRDPVLRECSWYYHMAEFCVIEVRAKLKEGRKHTPQSLCAEKKSSVSKVPHCGLMGCEARAGNITLDTVEHVVDPFGKYIHNPKYDITGGFYDKQIAHWLKYISRSQLLILNMDDLIRDHTAVTRSLFSFLNISNLELPVLPHTNGHGKYHCECDGLKEVSRIFAARNTANRTLELIRSPLKPKEEPAFTPFNETAYLQSFHCQPVDKSLSSVSPH